MNYKVGNDQLKNLIQKFVSDTLEEMIIPCESAFNNDFLDVPDWLNPHRCIDLEDLIKVVVNKVIKSEQNVQSQSQYPLFFVHIVIYYHALRNTTDWHEFMWQIRDRVQSKYKITLKFEIDQEINTYENRNW